MAKSTKIFVLDTNVVLHDYKCIYHFEDNDIVLPIVVLEELDRMKRGNDLINYHAREFTRELDVLSGDQLFEKCVKLGPDQGKLFIETGKSYSKNIEESFPERTPDHRILSIAEFLKNKHKDRPVILVSKDIHRRMQAQSLAVIARAYKSDQVQAANQFQKHSDVLDIDHRDLIQRLYD